MSRRVVCRWTTAACVCCIVTTCTPNSSTPLSTRRSSTSPSTCTAPVSSHCSLSSIDPALFHRRPASSTSMQSCWSVSPTTRQWWLWVTWRTNRPTHCQLHVAALSEQPRAARRVADAHIRPHARCRHRQLWHNVSVCQHCPVRPLHGRRRARPLCCSSTHYDVTCRSWRTFDCDAFERDLRCSALVLSPADDVSQLLADYDWEHSQGTARRLRTVSASTPVDTHTRNLHSAPASRKALKTFVFENRLDTVMHYRFHCNIHDYDYD